MKYPWSPTVRMVAPTVDAQTRMGLVYVDLPADVMRAAARAALGLDSPRPSA